MQPIFQNVQQTNNWKNKNAEMRWNREKQKFGAKNTNFSEVEM